MSTYRTPQLIDDFAAHFNTILTTHSRQTEAERTRLKWACPLITLCPLQS